METRVRDAMINRATGASRSKLRKSSVRGSAFEVRPACRILCALYAGFALTGAYTTMLGTLLPLLAARWALRDEGSGSLFLAQFLGSTLGAFLRTRTHIQTVCAGCAIIAVSCCGFALLPGSLPGWEWILALLLLFSYGLGLGMAMTSTSMGVAAHLFERRASAFELMNAVWALGAGATPWLVLSSLRIGSLRGFLFSAWIPAALLCVLLLSSSHKTDDFSITPIPAAPKTAVPRFAPRRLAILLGFLSFASVGAETSLGGWMTTYTTRAVRTGEMHAHVVQHAALHPGLHLDLHSVGAASAFWLGLLVARASASLLLLGTLPPLAVWTGSLVLVTIALPLLLATHSPGLLVVLAFACGSGIGPLYPLVLSYALRLLRGRWVFVLAGAGSAVVPWCTGLLSSGLHTIYAGLALPLGLALAMLLAVMQGRGLLEQTASGPSAARE